MFDSQEARFALDVVQKVSLLLRQIQQEMVVPSLTKTDRSPVTVGDFAAQALVARLLEEAFPRDPLVAEEHSEALRTDSQVELLAQVTRYVSRLLPDATPAKVCQWIDRGEGTPAQRFWTLDPIDGTKGFLRGQQYALALALLVDGQVQLGVLGCPHLRDGGYQEIGGPGSLLVAEAGRGAFCSALEGGPFQALQVTKVDVPREARLLRSLESSHTNADELGELARAMESRGEPIRMDSQAKYAVLAAGQGELLVRLLSPDRPNYREKIWDHAAGSIIIQEAGGRVTDLDGRPLDFTRGETLAGNRGLLASNGHLHEAALAALRTIGA